MLILQRIGALALGIVLSAIVAPGIVSAQSTIQNEAAQRECRALCPDLSDIACFQEKCAALFEPAPIVASPASSLTDDEVVAVVRGAACATRGEAHALTVLEKPGGGGARFVGERDVSDTLEVFDGDTVAVPDGYSAEITYRNENNLSRITLEPGSVFTLYCADTARVQSGIVQFVIDLVSGKRVNIETRNAIAGVRGTTFTVDAHSGERTDIMLEEGELSVAPAADPSDEKILRAGETATIENGAVSIGADDGVRGAPRTSGIFWLVVIVILGVVAWLVRKKKGV